MIIIGDYWQLKTKDTLQANNYITHYLNITSGTAKVFAEAKNVEKSSSSGK